MAKWFIYRAILSIFSILIFTTESGAVLLHSVKRDKKAAEGVCLAPVLSFKGAVSILERNGVRVQAPANFKQIFSVAMGIQHLELLSGPNSKFIEEYVAGAVFRFPKRRRYSEQTGAGILMGKNHTDGNVAHVMHELGHYVGNQGLYHPYKANVEVCELTRYSRVHYSRSRYRNEEFAETWAAFVTNPELLRESNQKGCRQAYEFFASYLPHSSEFSSCDRNLLVKVLSQPN